MSHHTYFTLAILWVLVLLLQSNASFGWFSSTGKKVSKGTSDVVVAEFSMDSFNRKDGLTLVEKAKTKAALPNSCWQNAYQNLFAGCSEILASEEQRSRLAWHLGDCFQKDTGRPPFPYCDVKSSMVECLKRLKEGPHAIYLEFYLQTNAICHQLQADAFKRQTERVVNELKKTAESAENKLENIEEQAERLLHTLVHIHNSLSSINVKTQELAQTSKTMEGQVNVVLEHSQSVYKQFLKIVDSQLELGNRQINMNDRLDEGMAMLKESTDKLGEEMNNLRNKAVEIEKVVGKVGDAMFRRMDTIQNKAEDIENLAETSLNRQRQLLESQSSVLEVLQTVATFLSQALEESRGTLRQLTELGHNQQQELIQSQDQLKQAHDHLVQNLKTISAAQETFESKQASMFLSLEKLSTLYRAILLESRFVRAVFIYCILIFALYIFTSTKQTYSVRSRLYIGLCVTILIELLVLRYGKDIERQAWIISIGRLIFLLLASCQLLYAIYMYRDYESLNHQMLQSLIEKVNGMQGNKQLLYDDGESDVDLYSWIDTDISEDELEDLDYMLQEAVKEGSIATSGSRECSLRNRRR